MSDLLSDLLQEFRRDKDLAEKAMAQLNDEEFFRRPAPHVNSVAIIVKHLAGNFASRWTDFLTTDGEKPWRDRDGEFLQVEQDTRASLMAAWDRGWAILLNTAGSLQNSDLARPITIRGEEQSAQQALLRASSHVAYHAGQILYLVRLLRPDSPWLTVAPGKSREMAGAYRKAT